MPTTESEEIELRSGDVRVYPATRELTVNERAVAIERRAFDLLVYLMRNADRVVDKDELFREVWHSRPVSESALPQAVSRVRRALGGDSDDWLATVYGVGYRFAQSVERVRDPASTKKPQTSPAASRRTILKLLAVGLPLLATIAAWLLTHRPADTEVRIAVLPVQNQTGDAQLDWVELGVLPLIDKALEGGGVQRVSTGQVLSTLRRYPEAQDAEAQARVLKLNSRVDRVVVPRLYVSDGGFRLEVRSVDAEDDDYDIDLAGADVAVLAVAAGTTLAESLSRWHGSQRAQSTFVTDDPFVNQAFVRGLDARLRGRWEDAARYFDTVLVAAPDLLEAKYHLALVTRMMGDWDYAEQLHEELLQAAEAAGSPSMLAAVQSISGTLAWRRGDKDAAEKWYTQALENYRDEGDSDYIASTTANLGILAATRGRFPQAEDRMREALVHYRSTGDRFNEATTLKNIGNVLVDQGRYDEAEEVLLESLEIRQTLELPLEVALTLSVLADVEMARGHWEQALAYQERVLETAEAHDSPTLEIRARSDLSSAMRSVGRLDDAVAMAATAYTQATELGSRTNQAFALLQQGRAELDRGLAARAESLFARAAQEYAEIDEPLGETRARIAWAFALIKSAQPDQAKEELAVAKARIEDSGLDHLKSSLYRAEAALEQSGGATERATELLEMAYSVARESQIPVDILQAGGALGLALLGQADKADRVRALAQELRKNPDASADALEFLSRYYAQEEPDRALAWAERRRVLVGEGWTSADEQLLESLRQ